MMGFTFRDRDGSSAKATFYCAWASSITEVWPAAYAIGDQLSALSDGVLYKIELSYRYTVDEPLAAADTSTNERKVLMLITNDDDEINGIMIPSPGDIFETTGSYAGIRVDLANEDVVVFADMLLAIDLRTDDNRQLGTVLAAGGLAL